MTMSISELIFEVQSTMDDIAGLNDCGRCGGARFITWSSVDHSVCFECNMFHEGCAECRMGRPMRTGELFADAAKTQAELTYVPYAVRGDAADISAETEADDYFPARFRS